MPPLPPPPPHPRLRLRFQPSRYMDQFLGDRQDQSAPTYHRSATDEGNSIATTTGVSDPSSGDSLVSDHDFVSLRPSSVGPPPGQSQSPGSSPPRYISRRSGSVTAYPRPRSPPPPYLSRSPGSRHNSPAPTDTDTAINTSMSLVIATRNARQTGHVSISVPFPFPGPPPGPSPGPSPDLSSDPSHHSISPPLPCTSHPFGHHREHSAPIVRLLSRPY
jgi:hypothetical protein